MSEGKKEFVNGLLVKPPNPKAPEFVKCNLSIRRADLITWLSERNDEWINIDVKSAKSGKWYAEVNQWKKPETPTPQTPSQQEWSAPPQEEIPLDSIPF